MKKNILKDIKDTDNKIKKVFDDFIEQRNRTSQLLQTSYEQLKTSSFNNNNNSKSLNISHEITLEGTKNDDSKFIKLTDHNTHTDEDNNDLLSKNQIYTQENDDQDYKQQVDNFNQKYQKNYDIHQLDISQDTENLLKSNDDLDIEFPISLRQMSQSLQKNQNNITPNIKSLDIRRQSQNSLRTSMESLDEDSLLSSLHNNSIFNGSQVNQTFQSAQQQQIQLQPTQTYPSVDQFQQNNLQKSNQNIKTSNKKSLRNCLKIRESEVDFGKLYIFKECQKSVEILNTSDRSLDLKVYFESDSFELNTNILQIPEFSSYKLTIICCKEDEQRITDSLYIEDNQSENIESNRSTDNCITLLVKAHILKPQLIIKSEQNMYVQGQQFTTIESKPNDFGEIIIYLTNPLIELSSELEVEVIQQQNDNSKITFFPQNLILKQQETKKVSFTISNKNQQKGAIQTFCVVFKINSSPIIFVAKVIYG